MGLFHFRNFVFFPERGNLNGNANSYHIRLMYYVYTNFAVVDASTGGFGEDLIGLQKKIIWARIYGHKIRISGSVHKVFSLTMNLYSIFLCIYIYNQQHSSVANV